MSYLREALEIVKDRDPLNEDYGYDRKRNPHGADKRSRSPAPDKSLQDALGPQDYKIAKAVAAGHEDLDNHPGLYEKLYSYLVSEMPYGTAKGREGDPHEWITDHLDQYV